MLEPGYIVEDFANAAALLEFLERKPCDLIVSDLPLPNLDGFDFIFALKKNTRFAGIPVVALTASGSDETRRRALAAGFAAYLVKPAPLSLLLSVIAENLRSVA
jgi:CheY-like chemotaxis protein